MGHSKLKFGNKFKVRSTAICITSSMLVALLWTMLSLPAVFRDSIKPNEGLRMPPHEHFEKGDDYRHRVWNKPQPGYPGTGKITIETTLPKGNHALTICMDHGWLDNHGYASSNYEEGFSELGLPVGQIKHGEIITVDVAAREAHFVFRGRLVCGRFSPGRSFTKPDSQSDVRA